MVLCTDCRPSLHSFETASGLTRLFSWHCLGGIYVLTFQNPLKLLSTSSVWKENHWHATLITWFWQTVAADIHEELQRTFKIPWFSATATTSCRDNATRGSTKAQSNDLPALRAIQHCLFSGLNLDNWQCQVNTVTWRPFLHKGSLFRFTMSYPTYSEIYGTCNKC